MEDMSGFYKKEENGNWLFAPNFVLAKDFELHRDGNRETIDGWQWHDEPPQEFIDWQEAQNLNEI